MLTPSLTMPALAGAGRNEQPAHPWPLAPPSKHGDHGFCKKLQNNVMSGLLPYRLMGITSPLHYCIRKPTYLTHEMVVSATVSLFDEKRCGSIAL